MQNVRADYLTHYFEIARYKWIFVLSIGLFLGFFLLLFQPFGVNNFDPSFRISLQFFLVIMGFSAVICAALAINEFLVRPWLLPNPTRKQLIGWLAWDYLVVATAAFGYYNYVGNWHDLSWSSYFGFVRDVSLVISFPVAAFLFFIRHEFVKSEFFQLRALKLDPASSGMVHYSSDNGKDRISIAVEDILYLESQDNYVMVIYMDNGVQRCTLIRSSLKRLEVPPQETHQVGASHAGDFHPPFLRCHRSYIVNLLRVRTCRGNRHGLKLTLEGAEKSIPVSRAYTERVLQSLDAAGQ